MTKQPSLGWHSLPLLSHWAKVPEQHFILVCASNDRTENCPSLEIAVLIQITTITHLLRRTKG
jgi:hypothetical protein